MVLHLETLSPSTARHLRASPCITRLRKRSGRRALPLATSGMTRGHSPQQPRIRTSHGFPILLVDARHPRARRLCKWPMFLGTGTRQQASTEAILDGVAEVTASALDNISAATLWDDILESASLLVRASQGLPASLGASHSLPNERVREGGGRRFRRAGEDDGWGWQRLRRRSPP